MAFAYGDQTEDAVDVSLLYWRLVSSRHALQNNPRSSSFGMTFANTQTVYV